MHLKVWSLCSFADEGSLLPTGLALATRPLERLDDNVSIPLIRKGCYRDPFGLHRDHSELCIKVSLGSTER